LKFSCSKAYFSALLHKNRQKIHFLLVGGLNTLFGLAAYPIIYFLTRSSGLGYLWVLAISQSICVTFAFFTNKNLVFKTQGNYLKEYRKFISFHASIFAINLILLPVLVDRLGLSPVIAQTLFSILIIVSSYFWYSRVTFK
jgi:putative flippase GtrA